ncbi:MAG: AGE family epimerase/isomerase [Pseudomonadota bacterium]
MTLSKTLDEMHAWMFDDALPFWSENGIDKNYGGFIEELDFSGKDAARPFKRIRVTCRQVYVFAHAKMMGWNDAEDLIARGVEFLTSKARREDGGFMRRVNRDGTPLDPTADLYDTAFALFAFAWAFRATGDIAYRDLAAQTFTWVHDNMRHPTGEGFWHARPAEGPRQQNPHMHFLEASIAANDALHMQGIGDDGLYKECIGEITNLFRTRFFNKETQTLTEFFNDELAPADGQDGIITEPGHHLEWAWILRNCERVLSTDLSLEIDKLIEFAERHGINRQGAVMNSVKASGPPIDAGSRTWPNTERLKAAIALLQGPPQKRAGAAKRDATKMVEQSGRLLLDRYLGKNPNPNSSTIPMGTIPRGTWIDAFDEHGKSIAERIPASTFYHIFLAFAELLDNRDKLCTE